MIYFCHVFLHSKIIVVDNAQYDPTIDVLAAVDQWDIPL